MHTYRSPNQLPQETLRLTSISCMSELHFLVTLNLKPFLMGCDDLGLFQSFAFALWGVLANRRPCRHEQCPVPVPKSEAKRPRSLAKAFAQDPCSLLSRCQCMDEYVDTRRESTFVSSSSLQSLYCWLWDYLQRKPQHPCRGPGMIGTPGACRGLFLQRLHGATRAHRGGFCGNKSPAQQTRKAGLLEACACR